VLKGVANMVRKRKISSLLFGILVWLIVINVTNPTVSITIDNVPITVINTEAITQVDKVYTIDSDQYVDVIVTGHRKEIEKISKDDITVIADLSKLSEINTVRLVASSIQPDARLEIKDEIMKLSIENCVTAVFDIAVNKIGLENPSCFVDSITPEIEKFKIKGPESQIAKIDKVEFTVDVADCTEEFEVKCEPILYDSRGDVMSKENFTFETKSVSFAVHTLPTKEVTLTINPVCSNYIKQYINTFSAVPTTVMIAAEQRLLDNTNILELNIPIELNHNDLSKETYTMKVDISQYVSKGFYIPDAYKNVDVVLGFAGEIKKDIEFTLQDIDVINLDEEKFTIAIQDSNFATSVFGPKSDVMNISIGDLNPYIDLSTISEGENTLFIEFRAPGNIMVTSCKVKIIAKTIEPETEPPTENTETTEPSDATDPTTVTQNVP
jgi:YbbR domain-containing protein